MSKGPDSSNKAKHKGGGKIVAHPLLSFVLLYAFIMLPTTLLIFGQPNSSVDLQRGISMTVANGCIAGYISLVMQRLDRGRAEAERRAENSAAGD